MIKVLAKDGQTMLIVTHHLKFASEIADEIIFLDKGEILQKIMTRDFIYAQTNSQISKYIKHEISSKNEINTYEGFDNFQAYHIGSLKRVDDGTTIYIVGGLGNRWHECMGKYIKEYESLQAKKKISVKAIVYTEETLDKTIKEKYPNLYCYRIIPRNLQNPSDYVIIGDSIIIQSLDDVPTVIEIHNKNIAKSYLNYFNLLWEMGKDL